MREEEAPCALENADPARESNQGSVTEEQLIFPIVFLAEFTEGCAVGEGGGCDIILFCS